MAALVRKLGLFYLTHMVTFFLLCAYSLASSAPNYPFLPAIFLPVYLAAAVALSEREIGDPLIGILPITPEEIMRVKFMLAFVFVATGWLNMGLFTALQGLPSELATSIMKLATLSAAGTLLLFGGFQLGLHFFGHSTFHKVIILYTVFGAIFTIVFFIGLAERARNYIELFPLIPFLESMPGFVAASVAILACVLCYGLLRGGPWSTKRTMLF